MIRQLLCWALGHGPWRDGPEVSMVHEGELRRAKRCAYCGAIVLGEVDG